MYCDYYKLAAFTEPTQWHTEHLISNYINKHYKGEVSANDAIKALLTTEEDSFDLEILKDLLNCAKELDSTIAQSVEMRSFISVAVLNEDFPKIVAKTTGFSLEDIHLLIPQELRHFISNPHTYKERFEQRRELFICLQSDFPLIDELIEPVDISSHESVLSWNVAPTTEPFIAEGAVAERALDKLNMCMNLFESENSATDTLNGVVAFHNDGEDFVEGIVHIIKNPKTESLETGEILVAPSTTPDFINAINKSKAIVTDWGGQTSHAAIVSRELKKPCVIGTNFASRFFCDLFRFQK